MSLKTPSTRLIESVCWNRSLGRMQNSKIACSRGNCKDGESWKTLRIQFCLSSDPTVVVASTEIDLTRERLKKKRGTSSPTKFVPRVQAKMRVFWVDPDWSKPSLLRQLCRRTFESLSLERDREGVDVVVRFDSKEIAKRVTESPCDGFLWLQ